MSEKFVLNNYSCILDMVKEIVDKLGHSNYEDGYYNDIYLGRVFKYGQLEIFQDKNYSITILINNVRVFYYDNDLNKIKYKNGEWPDLIRAIYYEIPNILNRRKIEEDNFKNKVNEMKSLEPYLSNYIRLYKKEGESIKYLNLKLYEQRIVIKKEVREEYEVNKIQGYDEKKTCYEFAIYYQGKKVMIFNDNDYKPLLDIEYYPSSDRFVQNYISGEWSNLLKNTMNLANEFDQKLINQEVNASSLQMIKCVKKIK